MGAHLMSPRTSAERRADRRTAKARDARRESLLVLLSRAQRTIPLTPAEGTLLRAHVEVELDEANQLRTAMSRQAAEHRHQLAAAHTAIEEAESDAGRALIRAATAEHQADRLAEELRPYRTAAEGQRQADRAASPCQAEQRPNYDYCPCNGMCHQCEDTPCDECQPPTTSTPEPQP